MCPLNCHPSLAAQMPAVCECVPAGKGPGIYSEASAPEVIYSVQGHWSQRCMYVRMYVRTHVRTYVCMYVSMYVRKYVCVASTF